MAFRDNTFEPANAVGLAAQALPSLAMQPGCDILRFPADDLLHTATAIFSCRPAGRSVISLSQGDLLTAPIVISAPTNRVRAQAQHKLSTIGAFG